MKSIRLVAACCVMLASAVTLGAEPTPLSAKDKEELKQKADALHKAYVTGDVQAIMDGTHEAIFKLVGTREKYESMMINAAKVLMAQVKFESMELGEPTPCHVSGKEEVTFLPKTSVMVVSGQRAKDVSFLIAVRTIGTTDWKFLDSAGLRKNPALLWIFFPDLPKDIKTPPNTVELLKPAGPTS